MVSRSSRLSQQVSPGCTAVQPRPSFAPDSRHARHAGQRQGCSGSKPPNYLSQRARYTTFSNVTPPVPRSFRNLFEGIHGFPAAAWARVRALKNSKNLPDLAIGIARDIWGYFGGLHTIC